MVLEWVVWLGVVAEGRFFVGCRVGGRAGGREEVRAEVFWRLRWLAGTVSLYYVLSCGQEKVMIFMWVS